MIPAAVRHRIAFNGGTLLLRHRLWRPAAFLLDRAIRMAPGHWEAHNNLAIAFLKLKRWEDAARVAERAIGLDPGAVESRDFLGIALLQLERWEEAVAVYRRAVTLNPGRYDSYDRLGMALSRLERWGDVVEVCEAALTLEAGHYATHHRLGMALLQLDRWDAAAEALRRAIALASSDPIGAGEVAGMRMSLANALGGGRGPSAAASPVDPGDARRQAAFWSVENLGADVFALERWLEDLTAVADSAPAGPQLLFVLDHDFGELTTVKYFLLGQGLAGRSTLLLPERLYLHNREAIPGRTRCYGSVADILGAVDRERPAIVFLCSGYLLCEHLSLAPGELDTLVDGLRERGCRVVTADPYLGLLSKQDPETLISFELPTEQAIKFLAEKYGPTVTSQPETLRRMTESRRAAEDKVWVYLRRSERTFRDIHHLYPSYCDVTADDAAEGDARNLSFFNDRLLRPSPSPRATRPHWLFILASTDDDLQRVFEGIAGFVDVVANKLTETVAAGRHPILIGPKPLIDEVRARLPSSDGIDLLSHCPFTQFMSLLVGAEHVFYWNAVSHSLLIRLYNRLPIVLFDRGHLLRIAPAVYRRIIAWYYQGWEPPVRDHHQPLTLETVEGWAADYRGQADRLVERYRRAPSPEQMIADLLSCPPAPPQAPPQTADGMASV